MDPNNKETSVYIMAYLSHLFDYIVIIFYYSFELENFESFGLFTN